jgi:hypothetical protein
VQGKELSEQASKYKKEARKLLEEKEKSGKSPNQTKPKTTFRGPVLSHRQQISGSFKCQRKGAYVWQNKKFMLIREEIRALPQRFKTKKLAITLLIK